jgi:MFS family permease
MSQVNPRQPWLHRAAVALLQTNRAVPLRSDDEIAAEVERNYRWNFTVNLLDGATFWFGITFISSSTIAPLFISKLTDSPLPIGLVAAIAQSAWFLPQVFTANVVEQLPRKKPIVINLGFFLERLPMWMLVLSALVAGVSPLLALLLFFTGYAWHGLGAGTIATAWQDLIARCFPVDRRGRFFGLANFLGAGMGVVGSAFSTWILGAAAFPSSFVYIFLIAASSLVMSWFFLSLTREPVQPISAPRQSNRQFLTGLPRIVRDDHNFRRFLVARSLLAVGNMGTGFVTVAAVGRWQVPDSTVGLYTAAYLIGQTAANLAFGLLADRFGHKLSLELGALASALAFVLACLAPSPGWTFVVFALLGISLGAVLVSGILVTLEFSAPARRPTYVGLANTVVGLVSLVAPLLASGLAGIGYAWVFACSATASLAALIVMRWWVREPRWAPLAQVWQKDAS